MNKDWKNLYRIWAPNLKHSAVTVPAHCSEVSRSQNDSEIIIHVFVLC